MLQLGTGNISFTATNLTFGPDTARVTVTPTFSHGGKNCTGPSEEFLIIVNPTANVIDPPDQVVCNGESTGEVVFGTSNTVGTVTYDWVNDNPSIGLGATGTGTIPSFIATNLTFGPDTARITVTPTFSHAGKNCTGPSEEFLIIVNPTPRIEVEVANDTICTDDVLTINVTNSNGPVEGDWEYILKVEYDASGDLLGDYTDPSYGPLSDPVVLDNLTNVGSTPLQVIYRFYPQINPSDGGSICELGVMDSIIVIVDPSPAIRVNPGDTALCNYGVTSVTIENPHFEVLGKWWYNLEITTDPLFPVTSSYDGDRDTIRNEEFIDTLFNPFADAHWIKYKFTPIHTYDDGVLCSSGSGEEDSVIFWVNPTPSINLTDPDPEICSGETIGLTTSKPNNPIDGHVWRYKFYVTQEPPENGELTSAPQLEDHFWNGDSVYSYTLSNSGNNAHRVTFNLMPVIEDPIGGGETCYGEIKSPFTVIYPVPQIDPLISDTLRCNSDEALWEITTPNEILYNGDWRYYVDISEPADIIDGESLSGYRLMPDGQEIRDTLFNNDINAHEVFYRFTPYIYPSDAGLACSGSTKDYTVWVNPTPVIDVTIPDYVFCNNQVIPFTVLDSLFGFVSPETSRQYEIYAKPDDPNHVSIFKIPSGNERTPSWPPNEGSPELLPLESSFADSIVNRDSVFQDVTYLFFPYIYDERDGRKTSLCGPGTPVFQTIFINPTPDIEVIIEDSIICNETPVRINIRKKVTPYFTHDLVYSLNLDYEIDSVDGVEIPSEDEFFISDTLINNSNTVQILNYEYVARLKDTRQVPPQEDDYCENVIPIRKSVKLNPTPRLAYQFDNGWGRDILCYGDSGIILRTDPTVTATNDIYYRLGVINDDYVSGVIIPNPSDSVKADNGLDQRSIRNDSMNLGIVKYIFSPFISVEGCTGETDTTVIALNPDPVMFADRSKDKVCYQEGFELPMSTPVGTTTGLMQYQLRTDHFTYANISGPVPNPLDTIYSYIDTLPQPLENIGDSIEDITYFFTPVILNARADLGDGGHCWGTPPKDSILVEVAPAFKYNLVADSVWGGWEIRCNGDSSLQVHSNVSGGYYRDTILSNGIQLLEGLMKD